MTEPVAHDLLTLAELAQLLCISERRALELVRMRDFPAPVSYVQPDEEPGVCNRCVRRPHWSRSEVLAWTEANPESAPAGAQAKLREVWPSRRS